MAARGYSFYPEEVPDKNFPALMTISGVPMCFDDFTRIFKITLLAAGPRVKS
jgi:hypothetical protein